MTLDSKEARWFAIYINHKCEKLACDLLIRKGIEAYVPLRTVIRKYGRQKRKRELPLISSYVFVKIVKSEYIKVLETEKVMSFIKFSGAPLAIPEREILIIKRIVGDVALDVNLVNDRPVEIGDKIEVIGGSLTGLNGILKELRGNQQVVVELETLGYSLTITMNKDVVAPLNQ